MATLIDRLDDSTLEKFQVMVERLSVIRNEKIWKSFKLRDAEFLLNDVKDSCPPLFLPMIRFYELEIQCLRWSLCPTELLVLEVEENCRELSKTLHQISKQLRHLPVTTKAAKVFSIEYRLMEAEVLMICAAIDFQKRNYITAAHTLVKSNDLFIDLAQTIDEIRGKSDDVLKTEGFISLCQRHLHGKGHVPEELLQNLRQLIDEKTNDIRRRHSDRRSAVPEEILEATRSLLQLKQLYADLSGKWRSSDGHQETVVKKKAAGADDASATAAATATATAPPLSPRRTKSTTNLCETSSTMPTRHTVVHATPRSPDSDDDEVHVEDADDDDGDDDGCDENRCDNDCSSSASTTPSPQKLKARFNVSPYKQSIPLTPPPRSPKRRAESRCLEAKFAIESPQKVAVQSVTSILPRMFSFAKYLPGYQQQTTQLKQISQRKKSTASDAFGNAATAATAAAAAAKATRPLATRARQLSLHRDDTDGGESGMDTNDEADEYDEASLEIDVVDFQALLNHALDDFHEQQLVKALARVHFAIALRNLLFANSPKQLKWMLNILKLVPNVTQSIVTLYQVHNFEDGRWGPLATLILLNMPASVLETAMAECNNVSIHRYLPINAWDQLHPLIEAQSMLATWTSKNPLWLSTVARSASANICTNSMTRLDFYRRSLLSEDDTFASGSPYGYFAITNVVAKYCVSLGHWTKAYNTARPLYTSPMVKRNVQLEALAVQVAAAAAASCSELFGYQNKYLHLKFSDQIILNSGAAALAEVAENGRTRPCPATGHSAVSANQQHFHPGISQFMAAFYPGGTALLNGPGAVGQALSGGVVGGGGGVTKSGSSSGLKPVDLQPENNLRGRLLFYHQLVDVSDGVDPWKDDSEALLRATGFWAWLLPIEFLYLASMRESFTQDALHNQMLQLCDKGAILFADRYLPAHLHDLSADEATVASSADASPRSNRHILGPLIQGIILDNMADADPAMACRALLLLKKLTIVEEHQLFTGKTSLRLGTDDRTGIIANSAFESLILATPSAGTGAFPGHSAKDVKHVETQAAFRCLRKIQSRLEKIKQKLEKAPSGDVDAALLEDAAQYLLDAPSSVERVYGDVVVLWCLLRGLIMKKLNRIWEAVVMFKLVEVCKDMAPRCKFAVFAAYTELAEIILDYEVCEEPLILAAEYLKRGCVSLRRVFETGYLPYVHEYRRKMKTLVDRLEQSR